MTLAFTPGDTFIPASGQVIGEREKELMHKAVDKGWLTASTFNREFEDALVLFRSQLRPMAAVTH